MKIKSVETFPMRYPLREPMSDATGVWHSWDTLIIKVTVESGEYGVGEIGPLHGGGLEVYRSIVETKLRPLLIGEDVFNRGFLFNKMLGVGTSSYAFGRQGAIMSAVGGIDIALWDLVAKILGTPVYNLLGGLFHKRIPAYASGFFGRNGKPLTAEECLEEARYYKDLGFKGIKMKIGFDRGSDLKNVEVVREALGDDILIMIDSNQGFSLHEAKLLVKRLEEYNIYFWEEPLSIFDIDGMIELSRYANFAIAAGENYYTAVDFKNLLEVQAIQIAQPDIIHSGGITGIKKISGLCEVYDIPLAPHIHATVGFAASVQLLAACSNTLMAEYIMTGGSYELRRELFGDVYIADGGYIEVPELPGLGLELNEEVLQKYLVK